MSRLFMVIGVLLLSTLMHAQAPFNLEEPVPVDPQVRMGVLENGLTYYIRHNEEPKERASFYIIQNVGAILEEDNQNGLAHFLEHMSFNGTEHFPGKGIINTLERHGVAFGRNINAYTAQDETVYNLSDVPVGPEGLIDTCLLVLHDWSDYLLLTDEEIDSERGVITEEWRTRRDSRFRIRNQFSPVLYNHSKYAKRDVIGDLDVIKHHDYNTLRKFYHDWYRTDLQAIAVVGDFDVDEVEAKVKKLFSEIKAVDKPMERYTVDIPDNEEPLYTLATDKEATRSSVALYIKSAVVKPEAKNLEYLRTEYMKGLVETMLNDRISELLQKGNPPFIHGGVGFSGFTRTSDVLYISASAKDNEEAKAFEAILKEVMRAKNFGFTPGELERAKTNMLVGFETAYKQRNKISNDRFCREYKEHYLNRTPIAGIEYEYQFGKSVIPEITVEEVSALFASAYTPHNRVIIVTGPAKEGVNHLTEAESLAIIDKVENDATISAYEDVAVADNLIEGELPAASVIATKELPQFNAVEWTLSNNAKVVYRFADYNKERVSLNAYSRGGTSLYEKSDLPTADMTTDFMGAFGLGAFDAIALNKALTGKNAEVSTRINGLSEGLYGSARTQDFETMMQLLYLHFENPRFDKEAFTALMQRNRAAIANRGDNPRQIIRDSLSFIFSDYNPRVRKIDGAYLDDVDFDRMKEIYQERFSNAADFTFFIVGDIPQETVKEMATKYIGAIKSTDSKENWVDRKVEGPKGITVKNIPLKMTTPKSTVIINYDNDIAYTPENRIMMSFLEGILDLRYTESVREKEGGTYGVGVRATSNHYPESDASLLINFDCDPDRANDLIPLIYKELEAMVKNGPSQEDVDKVRKNLLKGRKERKEKNGYWVGVLYSYYVHGVNNDDPDNYENIIENMTTKDIKKAVGKFLKKADKIQVVFEPKAEN
ncbi:insulinase family protein [Marinilabiliaceae bacterium JC017]|nr:insulinase family protein [Marinilabiliaceae bacterium JC017]